MTQEPKNLSRKVIHTGYAVEYQELTWQGADGEIRVWEAAERVSGRDAVLILPWLRPSNRLLLISQYRPPVGAPVIEFPAGLIDDGESPETAAFRELVEETGYHGTLTHKTPPTFNSPGLTSEAVYQFVMDIDEESPANQDPQPALEPTEHIEVLLVPQTGLLDFLDRQFDAGHHVDSKVVAYILGLCATS